MVRINLVCNNTTTQEIPLNFSTVGDLIMPLTGFTKCSVLHFSIPNAATPILEFQSNYYQFTLTYGLFSFSQYVEYENRGSGDTNIYEIDHLVSMMNTALQDCLVGLDNLDALPTAIPPRIVYDTINDRYSIIVPDGFYTGANAIGILFNTPLFYILESLPTNITNAGLYEVIVTKLPENIIVVDAAHGSAPWAPAGTYLKITQEANTLSNYATPKYFVMTTTLPIEQEVVCSSTQSNDQSMASIIQTFTFDYLQGVKALLSNNDYSSVINDYRIAKMMPQTIYVVKADIKWLTNTGAVRVFNLPPNTSAKLVLNLE